MKKMDKQILLYMVQELGFALIPICVPINSENCHQHGSRCVSPGKVPIISKWEKVQEVSPNTLQTWLNNPDDINFGLILGQTKHNNIVGIDIDGEFGYEKLKELEEEHGKLPDTIKYKTGNGMRYLFKLPQGAVYKKVSFYEDSKRERGEFALLCQGQQTIIPPSLHHTGFIYEWEDGNNPMEIEMADAPNWLIKILREGNKDNPDAKTGSETSMILNLLEEKEKLKKGKVSKEDFEEGASEGGRHNKMVRIVGSLVANHKMDKELVLTAAEVENHKRFKPPLPKKEINTIVQSLWDAEEKKIEKAKEKKKSALTPIFLAKKFLEDQAAKTISWRYSETHDCFYVYDSIDPPWKMVSNIALEQAIANTVLRFSEALLTKRTMQEIRYQLKIVLLDTEKTDVFNLGKFGDSSKLYVNNGVLDLETMELMPWSKDYLTTIKLPINWNPDARNHPSLDLWRATLHEWISDESSIKFIQEFFGYTLTPNCKRRTALFLYGEGHNGKSLMLEILEVLYGEHISKIPLKKISGRFTTKNLMNQLVNICADISNEYIQQTSIIKRIVAGESLHGEIKYGASFDFNNTAKLIFSANKLPRAADTTEGWYSRWKIVKFPHSFEVDDNYYHSMLDTFHTKEGKEVLLYWAVEGLLRLRKNNSFTHSEVMHQEMLDYMRANDSVVEFLDDCTEKVKERNETTRVATTALYTIYKEWCQKGGVKPKSFRNFIDSVQTHGFNKKRTYIENGDRKTAFLGMKLVEEAGLIAMKPRLMYLMELRMEGGA